MVQDIVFVWITRTGGHTNDLNDFDMDWLDFY